MDSHLSSEIGMQDASKNPQPIRVVHIIGRLIPGGVERRTLDLIQETSKLGFQHYVCITSGQRGTLDDDYRASGARLEYLKIKSPFFFFRFLRFLRVNRIQVIHSNIMYMSGLILAIGKLANTPKRIAHFRSDGSPRNSLNFISRIKQYILHKFIDNCANHIVGLTPKNLEIAWSKEWQRDNRCIVIPNGVRVAEQRDTLIPTDMLEKESDTIIIHVGRGDLPSKNRGKAIRIFSAYNKLNRNSQLFFIGRDGKTKIQAERNLEEWSEIARQTGVAERVHFLAEKDSVAPYMFHADVLLLTSSLEGLPGVVIEALSFGVPVVSSDVPGAVYISQHISNIQILEVNAADNQWAESIMGLDSKLNNSQRKMNMKLLRGSVFDLQVAASSYAELWSPKLQQDRAG